MEVMRRSESGSLPLGEYSSCFEIEMRGDLRSNKQQETDYSPQTTERGRRRMEGGGQDRGMKRWKDGMDAGTEERTEGRGWTEQLRRGCCLWQMTKKEKSGSWGYWIS